MEKKDLVSRVKEMYHKSNDFVKFNRRLVVSELSTLVTGPVSAEATDLFTDNDLIIKVVPDIFVSGHTHKGGVLYYKNILLLSTTCWEIVTVLSAASVIGKKYDVIKKFNATKKTNLIKI